MLCRRSSWFDMVVFRMNFPPPSQPLARLRSGSRLIIRRCQSPALAVPDAPLHLGSALLAYGPGRKADEALYVATYVAGRWQIPLTVLTVETSTPTDETAAARAEHARQYLESHGVHAQYVTDKTEDADAGTAVLLNAEYHNADLLIMGGYESAPLLESLKSSTVDRVLRSTRRPVLICR
jgi:nucleotide-binding universal stress UspA family protein